MGAQWSRPKVVATLDFSAPLCDVRGVRRLTYIACAASLTLAATAHAAGLDSPLIGTAASGPLTLDAAAIWHNPAALAQLKRPQLLFGAQFVLGGISYTRQRRGRYQKPDGFEIVDPVDPTSLDASLTGDAASTGATIATGAGDLFLAVPVHDRVVLGAGLYVPYAAPVAYDEDGPQRWSLQEAFMAMPHATASVGVKLHPRISVGGGVSAILGTANMRKVQDFAALDAFGEALDGAPANQDNSFGADAPTTVRELDVLARQVSITDATAFNVTFNLGLYAQPTDDLRLALTYQHGADLVFEGDFALDLSDDLFTQDLGPTGLAFDPLVTGRARLGLVLPKRIGAAGAWRFSDRFELEGRLHYITWSDLEALRITLKSPQLAQPDFGLPDVSRSDLIRNWNDSVYVDVYGHLAVGRASTLTVGLGYQSPASPDETVDVASPDGQRFALRGQLAWPLGTDDAAQAAWLMAVHGTVEAIVPRAVTDSDNDLANGSYSMAVGSAGVHMTWRWGANR
jgi:long-chain fatty acid transport protein